MRNLGEGQYFGESVKSAENELFKLSMTHYAAGEDIGLHDHDNNYLSILTSGNYMEDSKNRDSWKKVSVKKINKASDQLLKQHTEKLLSN